MDRPGAAWTVRGKYVVITGATSGIGLAAARELARRGASIGIVARNAAKAEEVAAELERLAAPDAAVDLFMADLSSQESIRRAAEEIADRCPRVDVLVNNAGAMFVERKLTTDGIERTWAVNHLGPFLLTTLLLEKLMASGDARIITTASHGHRMARKGLRFDDLSARGHYGFPSKWLGGPNYRYGETKLANILFTAELARRTSGTGISAASFDPGLVATNFNQDNGRLARMTMAVLKRFSRTPEEGAETLVWLADSDEMTTVSGGYYRDKRRAVPSAAAQDPDAARRLWEISAEQVRGPWR